MNDETRRLSVIDLHQSTVLLLYVVDESPGVLNGA